MSDTSNSRASRAFEILVAVLLLLALSAAAILWLYQRGYLLYYGDALAHLNIARRIVDSRTPGLDQIGTVWLPLPHLLMLPFVGNDFLWRSGLAGAIPSGICFIVAGAFLFAAARRVFDNSLAAAVALAAFALNPNILYLQSIPMTEAVFFAAFCALLYYSVRFARDTSFTAVFGAAIAVLAATMTRYEGWFLIPFVTVYFLIAGRNRRWTAAILFGGIASLGPLYWLAHNQWFFGDPLEFYHGAWSAKAIYQRSLDSGMKPYPGDGDWPLAFLHYVAAVRMCAGWPLAVLGLTGVAVGLWKRKYWPLAYLLLPPVFYVWSVHSSGTPIFVPDLWPDSYYNTRYGLSALPLLAIATGALVLLIPRRWRVAGAAALVLTTGGVWLSGNGPEISVCWKESEVNSVQRREWTRQAADLLRANYHGGGVIAPFGDVTGVFLEAGIPLREMLHDGNSVEYSRSLARPDLFLKTEWAIALSGDAISTAILRAQRDGPHYDCVKMIGLDGAPVIEIYRRNP
jgi:hypothetical protein